jgi:hypothetical protein
MIDMDARKLRKRAQELRGDAEATKNLSARETFRKLADSYDVLAEKVEKTWSAPPSRSFLALAPSASKPA